MSTTESNTDRACPGLMGTSTGPSSRAGAASNVRAIATSPTPPKGPRGAHLAQSEKPPESGLEPPWFEERHIGPGDYNAYLGKGTEHRSCSIGGRLRSKHCSRPSFTCRGRTRIWCPAHAWANSSQRE